METSTKIKTNKNKFKTSVPGIRKYEIKKRNPKSKNNLWYMVDVRCKDINGKSHKIFKKGFETLANAKEYMEQEKNNLKNSSDTKFEVVYQRYIEHLYKNCSGEIQQIKASSLQTKLDDMKNHIYGYFKDMPLNAIDRLVIEDWKNQLIDKKYSFKYRGVVKYRDEIPDEEKNDWHSYSLTVLNHCISYLSQLFNYAVKEGYIKESPMLYVDKIISRNKRELKRLDVSKYWSIDDYVEFIKYTKRKYKKHYYYIFETCFWSGARIGEVLALRKKDIDFKNKRIYIRNNISGKEAYKDEGGDIKFKNAITTPKGGKTRSVNMTDKYFKEIKEYMDGIYGLEDNDRIFNITKKTVQNFFKRTQENMRADGMPIKEMTVHGLRHAYIIYLISSEKNLNLKIIGERVGHSQVEMTEMYADLVEDRKREITNLDEETRAKLNY